MNFIPHNSGQANIQRGRLTFANPQLDGWQWPMVEIRGDRPGPRLCVMAGMHVNEVSSIEAAVQLQRRIRPESLRGSIAILPILNLPAVPVRSQYVCPIDGKNINFSFPGHKEGSFSADSQRINSRRSFTRWSHLDSLTAPTPRERRRDTRNPGFGISRGTLATSAATTRQRETRPRRDLALGGDPTRSSRASGNSSAAWNARGADNLAGGRQSGR